MSLTSLLSIARTALLTQQRAIDTTGHNVANASTDGYSRQRLVLAPETPLQTPVGQVGRGVTAASLERVRDRFLDAGYRRENGDLGRYQTTQDLMGQVEQVFGEPSDTGIAAGIDELLGAFGDLANDPTGQTSRTLVRQAAANLAQRFRDTDRRLGEAASDVVARMGGTVSDINEIAKQIADLNVRIRSSSAGQREAPDVKDQRDRLVDQLSGMVGVRVLERDDGTIAVATGDALLVDGGQSATLELRDLGNGQFTVGMTGTPGTINLQSGSLGALVELSTSSIPGVRAQLDKLAAGIVDEINRVHQTARTLTGATGVSFFDPAGRTAASMALSGDVARSTDSIAAGQSGGPGDNSAALAIAQLRTTGVASFGGNTIGQAYQRVVSDIGVLVHDATQKQAAQDVIVNHADSLRKSVSGVSIDEEMTSLISQQHAYAAAARLVTAADEMIQSVIAMVR